MEVAGARRDGTEPEKHLSSARAGLNFCVRGSWAAVPRNQEVGQLAKARAKSKGKAKGKPKMKAKRKAAVTVKK